MAHFKRYVIVPDRPEKVHLAFVLWGLLHHLQSLYYFLIVYRIECKGIAVSVLLLVNPAVLAVSSPTRRFISNLIWCHILIRLLNTNRMNMVIIGITLTYQIIYPNPNNSNNCW